MSPQKPGAGIRCQLCHGPMRVLDSRNNAKSIRRRRECLTSGCAGRVTTVEVVAPRHRKGSRANTTNLALVPDGHDLVAVPRAVVRQLHELLAQLNMTPFAPLTEFPVRKKRAAA